MIPANETPTEQALRVQSHLKTIKREAINLRDECATDTVKLFDLVAARLQAFIYQRDELFALANDTDVQAAYEALYPNVTFSALTELTSVYNGLVTIINFIVTQIPKGAGGELLVTKFDANNKIVQVEITDTSNGGPIDTLQSHAQALVDLID